MSAIVISNDEALLFQRGRSHAIEQFGDWCASGEADLVNGLTLAHLLSNLKYILLGGDHIDDAIRNTCTSTQLETKLRTKDGPELYNTIYLGQGQ